MKVCLEYLAESGWGRGKAVHIKDRGSYVLKFDQLSFPFGTQRVLGLNGCLN